MQSLPADALHRVVPHAIESCARVPVPPAMPFPPDAFLEALQTFSRHERMDPLMLLCKLTEEAGELAEAVLVERGFKPHKTLEPDAALGEAADVLMCLLLVLCRLHPERSPEQIAAQLAGRMDDKLARYVARQPRTAVD
jgi:NTP pyrophosphatase (non-canonical NTP hydrolase)